MESHEFQEILKALKQYSKETDRKIDALQTEMNEGFKQVGERFEQVDKRFEQIDQRFEKIEKRLDRIEDRMDRSDKKYDGLRVDMTETQETTDYLSSKVLQHEEKYGPLAKTRPTVSPGYIYLSTTAYDSTTTSRLNQRLLI